MRIRSIKPEFWTSDDITELAIEDRFLFIGLWSYVDDNGVGRDEEHLIVASLFPRDMFLDPRETVARVSRGLSNLAAKGLILRYQADGKAYLEITTWKTHQRIDKPNKPRFPQHDATPDTLATPSRDPREVPAPGTEEQRNRGTEEQRSTAAKAAATPRLDVDQLCDELAASVARRSEKRKPRITKAWKDEARRLLDVDEVPLDHALKAIDWAENNQFWQSVILTPKALRKHYDQMLIQAKQPQRRTQSDLLAEMTQRNIIPHPDTSPIALIERQAS